MHMNVNYSTDKSKTYSELNKVLFQKGKEIMENKIQSPDGGNNLGWCGFSSFIDYLEETYTIKLK